MQRFSSLVKRFSGDQEGVTALEYGIIAGVLGLVLVTIFTTFGTSLSTLFGNVAKGM
jgi:pilus assembly protein Flp/PilA